ncbi:hypothetical protein IFR05_003806 [Cadophora sp. M221]|nr:hypothetical protein IFR05_003806 [Cadophora sp. M221]
MENTDVAPSFIVSTADFVMPDIVANPGNAIALPLFAALALIITYLPLRSFYRVKNIAACSIMVVIIIINLTAVINGILWPSDDWTKWWIGYGVCDVEVVLRFPVTMALATSLCCLSKGLADALDTDHALFNPSKKQRRRKMIGDVLFCWLVPVMQMLLHYTVQAGRYMIIPVWGCADQLDNSWPMLVIIIGWCPIFQLLTVYYAAQMLIRLYRHRRSISAALTTTGSGLAPRKFIKLALISLILIIIYLPVQTVFVFYAIPHTFVPYSWSRIHNPTTWSPILFVHTGTQQSLQWTGWAGVAMSAVMFAFFGFNDDAVDTYRGLLVKCGAGWVWPSLKLSREQRRASETLVNNTMDSRGSFKSQFDLVGKAMKYFDAGARKDSHATGVTLVNGSTTASRKGSQDTFSNTTLSHIPTSTSTAPSLLHNFTKYTTATSPNSGHQSPTSYFAHHQHGHFDDKITVASSRYGDSNMSPTTLVHPQTPSSTTPLQSSLHTGIFSMLRTHLNLPFNAFTSSRTSSKANSSSRDQAEMSVINSRQVNSEKDIEAQYANSNIHTSSWPRCTSSIPSHTTIRTNIWSSPPSPAFVSKSNTLSNAHPGSQPKPTATHPSHAHNIAIVNEEYDESIDPHTPKMGTRAYRERERREFAASSLQPSTSNSTSTPASTSTSTSDKKIEHSRIRADNVHQELGTNILLSHPQAAQPGEKKKKIKGNEGTGMGMGGVVVRRSLDIKEERADGSAPF